MVAVTRWNPMREMVDMTDRMNRLFGSSRPLRQRESDDEFAGVWSPAVDVRESESGLAIIVELPGLDPKEVDISVENGLLTIRGERQFEDCDEGERYHRVERVYGSFERSFRIPSAYEAESIAARAKDGVLTLTIPKREEAKLKSIKVEVQAN